MSHTTPAIAIAELQGQLADAKTEVADSLSYLTDCRTTVAASSFATVMAAGVPESTAPVESDEYYRTLLSVENVDNGLIEAFQHCPEFWTDNAVRHQVVDRIANFTHDACLQLRRELTHDVLNAISGFESKIRKAEQAASECEVLIQKVQNSVSTMKNSTKASDVHNLKMLDIKKRFDEDLGFIKDKSDALSTLNLNMERKERESAKVENREGRWKEETRDSRRSELNELDREMTRLNRKIDRLKEEIVNHFEYAISAKGRVNHKPEKINLNIRHINLVHDKSNQLTKNVIGWMRSNSQEYALIIPFVERIAKESDPDTGLQWEDFPSQRNNFKPADSGSMLNADRLKEFQVASSKLYNHLTSQLNPSIVQRHLLLASYGLYKTSTRRGYEGDGITLFCMVFACHV